MGILSKENRVRCGLAIGASVLGVGLLLYYASDGVPAQPTPVVTQAVGGEGGVFCTHSSSISC